MTKRIQADLHVHTSLSDSTMSPREVIDRAVAVGLDMIAVTDHDTMHGVAEAQRCGERRGVTVVPGVEVSTYHGTDEFHILGLYVDAVNVAFLEKLEMICKARLERIYEISAKLKQMGVDVEAEEVIDLAAGGSPGRTHVARVLLRRGYVGDISEAFSRYVGDSAPAIVPKRFMTVEQAIAEIRNAGGVSILAHPGLVQQRDAFIPLFAEMGLNGLEAFYPSYRRMQTQHYLELAARLGLVASGGSDCHGSRRDGIMLGRVRLPGHYVEKIFALARMLPGSIPGGR